MADADAQYEQIYEVMYVGCISIARSMKDTIFEDRSALTKECISRVAESARCITMKDRKVPAYIKSAIKDLADLTFGGYSVELCINTFGWAVKFIETHRTLFYHDIRSISFASAGDGVTADFIAYVAKNDQNDRRCYVFDCPSGNGQEIITSMGNSFKQKFEQVTKSPRPSRDNIDPQFSLQTNPWAQITPSSPVSSEMNENRPRQNSMSLAEKLQNESWFHGKLSREQGESLIKQNGEFLVRQSQNQPDQFVLTGMQDNVHRHLLLIDDQGNVRTKDRNFNDISDLIEFHRKNNVPITSAESSLILRTPVDKFQNFNS